MSKSVREFRESPWEQGKDEARYYSLDTEPWGGGPSSVSAALFDSGGVDVTDANMPGDCSVNGDVITTPLITGLEAGATYRLEIRFVIGGRTEEAYGHIYCAR